MSFTNAVPEHSPRAPIPTVLEDSDQLISVQQQPLRSVTSVETDEDVMSIGPLSVYDVTVQQGVCLMIVNKKFKGRLSDRKADHQYIDTFCSILDSVKIRVTRRENRTRDEMLNDLETLNTQTLTKDDSILFVVVVSHGTFGKIYGTDEKPVTIREITQSFSVNCRPELKGVPKVFIIQCCQKFEQNGRLDLASHQRELIPVVEKDVHVEYSALPGQYDFDVSRTGSVYFCQLNKVLKKHMHDMKLTDIFQHTRRKLEEGRGVEYKGVTYKPCSLSSTSLVSPIRLGPDDNVRGPRLCPVSVTSGPGRDDVSYNSLRTDAQGGDQEGYMTSVPAEVSRLLFFFPDLCDKDSAKEKLAPYRGEPGHYLLRRSREAGKFTFAITHEKGQLLYMRMNMVQGATRLYSLVSGDREFRDIESLVRYYREHAIPNKEQFENVHLKTPICK